MLQPSSSLVTAPKLSSTLVTIIGNTLFIIASVALFLYLVVLKPTPKPICYSKESSPSGETWTFTHSVDETFDVSTCVEEALVPDDVVNKAKKSAQAIAEQEKSENTARIATRINLAVGFLVVPAVFVLQKILKRRKNFQKQGNLH